MRKIAEAILLGDDLKRTTAEIDGNLHEHVPGLVYRPQKSFELDKNRGKMRSRLELRFLG
jgi:hypothetical protein